MLSFWKPEPRLSSERKTEVVSREVSRLLEEQERLLALPMSTADMLLYELRSEQIKELVEQLRDDNRASMPR
jgi:hypothetical protein